MKLHNIDVDHLRVFIAVAENNGITNAQFVLGTDKSTISRKIKDLESRLGQSLCTRGRSGFSLTQAGDNVYLYARQLMVAIEDFANNCDSLRNQLHGSIEIAMPDSMTTDPSCPLPQAIRSFMTKYPAVTVTVSTIQTAFIEAEILSGKYQVGILPERQNKQEGISYFHLYEEVSSVYCAYNSGPFSRNEQRKEDLLGAKFVNMSYPEWLHMHELLAGQWHAFPLPTVARSVEAAALMILSGRFIGFLPRHIGKLWVDDGRMRPVLPELLTVRIPIHVAVKNNSLKNAIVAMFLRELNVSK